MKAPVIGMDVRMDEKGRIQPWRVVVANGWRPWEHYEYLIRLPEGLLYMTQPFNLLHGDLTLLEHRLEPQVAKIAERLRAMRATSVLMSSSRMDTTVERLLTWHGFTTVGHDIDMPFDDVFDDPYSIGGEAGHDIANVVRICEDSK
jgi:hypothetical protein